LQSSAELREGNPVPWLADPAGLPFNAVAAAPEHRGRKHHSFRTKSIIEETDMRRWLLLLAFLLPAAPADAAEPTKITLVQSSYSFNFVPLAVARTEGYFAAEGLDVDVVLAGGGPKTMTALLGGGGQFSASVLLDGIMAHRKGLDDVRAIATLSLAYNPVLIRTEVAKQHNISLDQPLRERMAAIKGMKIAITTPGASSDMVVRYLALTNGLSPDRDLQIVPLGSVPAQAAGLRAGQVDGCACLPGVDMMTNQEGLTTDLIRASEMPALDGITYGTLYGLASYNQAHPDIVRGVARAVTRATMLIASDPDRAKRATRPFFKQMDEAAFDESWRTYLPYLPKTPDITASDYDKELAFEKVVLPPNAYKPVPFDDAVDTSFVRAAMKELSH
jgi:NitT/TauT family transport system substrate-binding protein